MFARAPNPFLLPGVRRQTVPHVRTRSAGLYLLKRSLYIYAMQAGLHVVVHGPALS